MGKRAAPEQVWTAVSGGGVSEVTVRWWLATETTGTEVTETTGTEMRRRREQRRWRERFHRGETEERRKRINFSPDESCSDSTVAGEAGLRPDDVIRGNESP